MTNLKHVGRMANNQRRIVVAFRAVPGEPENCIVITTENLNADEHDTLIKMVESNAGQDANDLSQVMSRTTLPDGRNMLAHFHRTGKMVKVPSNTVEMMPNRNTSIMLNELNEMIAQQQGVTVEDLATPPNTGAPAAEAVAETTATDTAPAAPVSAQNEPLSDDALASQLRSQADTMFKEAKRLREEAEQLSPTKKSTKKKAEESA
jgi:hypothetical protein